MQKLLKPTTNVLVNTYVKQKKITDIQSNSMMFRDMHLSRTRYSAENLTKYLEIKHVIHIV